MKPQVYRVCAICGKRHGPTYGFKGFLSRNGIKGDKATIECVKKLQRKLGQSRPFKEVCGDPGVSNLD